MAGHTIFATLAVFAALRETMPIIIPTLLKMCIEHADKPLFTFTDGRDWQHITYAAYLGTVRGIAAGLVPKASNPVTG